MLWLGLSVGEDRSARTSVRLLGSDDMGYLLGLDIAVLGTFVLRAWHLESKANRYLRQPVPGMPFTSLDSPEHFRPEGEAHRRRANAFVRRGFALVFCYLLLRTVL